MYKCQNNELQRADFAKINSREISKIEKLAKNNSVKVHTVLEVPSPTSIQIGIAENETFVRKVEVVRHA